MADRQSTRRVTGASWVAARRLLITLLATSLGGWVPGSWTVSRGDAQDARHWEALRLQMVQREVYEAGVQNERVCEALRQVPRHLFVASNQRPKAYLDMALPIGEGQTISPPFIVGYMTEQLDPQPSDRVLEIGTGSGYQAAVLSHLVKDVYSIEIVESLGRRSAALLRRLRYSNVHTRIGDGFQGWPEKAPFDKIIVTCSPERIPQPLIDQLSEGGRIIVPLGERFQQSFYLFTKRDGQLQRQELRPTFFVPMTGRAEQLRKDQTTDRRPRLINGGFEEVDEAGLPKGWYYARQVTVEEGDEAPYGQRFLRCRNEEAGRHSQVLQAVGVDGKLVSRLEISLRVRTTDAVPGQSAGQLPALGISFFDEKQAPLGGQRLGPWFGTSSWTEQRASVAVPPQARLAVLVLGMFGGVGTADFDELAVTPADSRTPAGR